MLLIIVALGVFTAFDVGTRSSAEERHRARAQALAEADVARMESMRIADLASHSWNRNVTQDGLTYTIQSSTAFVNETASTSTCAAGASSRDYIRVQSSVTWPTRGSRPPVTVTRIVSPPNGSIIPNSGSLMVSVKNAQAVGTPGVTVSGTGVGSFTGTTGPTGCVLWRNLPAGNYTITLGGAVSGKIDPDGEPPSSRPVSVVAQSTNTVALEYDTPGRIQNVTFRTEPYGNGSLITSSADSLVVDHSSMNSPEIFTPSGGGRATSFTTTSTLYPFPSVYTLYAGVCTGNLPPGSPALGSAAVTPGGSANLASPGYIQLPALHVTVYEGNNTNSSRAQGATVELEDDDCSNFTRTATTNSSGRLDDPGFPWSTYDICVSGTASDNRDRFETYSNVDLKTLSPGIAFNVFLRSGDRGSC
jgi:hypothetical protein